MRTIPLQGVNVRLGTPRMVTEGVGHHWFPSLARFPTGELMLSHCQVGDTNEELVNTNGITISRDSGETWEPYFDVPGFIGGSAVRVATPEGGLGAPGYYMYPEPAGQYRRFTGHYERFENGGRRFILEPWSTLIDGLPRDVRPSAYEGKWGRRWMVQFNFWGNVVDVGDGVLSVCYLRYQGEEMYTTVALKSGDYGRTWHYVSQVASIDEVPGARHGPNESTTVRLADGDLMCVMRVGSGPGEFLARTYSSDNGKTWTKPDLLPAFSVAPCIRRLQNGALVLGTGRPGIYLWISTDLRGQNWQSVDIVDHHNAWAPNAGHIIIPDGSGDRRQRHDRDQTTAYVVLEETSPNHLILTYDRTPFGWHPVPTDSDERSRIYILPVEIELA